LKKLFFKKLLSMCKTFFDIVIEKIIFRFIGFTFEKKIELL